jgi:uncharacterized membrane protein
MEAFSDGVIAILITIMVFDLKPPAGSDIQSLLSVLPSAATYLLSFVYLGIYWNNHHHMVNMAMRIDGTVLWANLHLLFWLSLFPFTTRWLRSSGFGGVPVAAYGIVLLLAAAAYLILQDRIIRADGPQSKLRDAVGADWKGKISLAMYVAGIAFALPFPQIAMACYIIVALIWLIPDRRIESFNRTPDNRTQVG